MTKLLEKKVATLKSKVADIADDQATTQQKLKENQALLMKKKLAMNQAQINLDAATGEYNAQNKLVGEVQRSLSDNGKELADLRIELLKAEDAKRMAEEEAAQTLKALKDASVKNTTSSNSTIANTNQLENNMVAVLDSMLL